MGSVWRAKQTEPVKRFVAVKLIKAGMDSKQVLARFDGDAEQGNNNSSRLSNRHLPGTPGTTRVD
jgi:hypothetical protein